ncbi:MAG TPA: sigma-54-dependent Fis family transcriptional regulator [Firmicutes bacterium]|jgi:arginine utilization regulatory protein|nr:sigma-54-dependent Fis family transcriptional regulator [Bacillota bacterium]
MVMDVGNFHLILDSIDEGIQVVDRNGVTVFYNRVAANLDNLKPEEVLGKHVLEVFPSLCRETSTLLQVLKTGQPVLNREQTFMNYKGDTITTINSTLPIVVDNKVIGAVEVSRDITLIQEMARRIVDLQTELFAKKEGRRDIGSDRAHYTFKDIVGESESILELKRKAARAAGSASAVLVQGETGTGKELFVQAIHNAGTRRTGPFIAQNCAALPEGLLEGILFGTTKGGFTGACDRPGLFELADSGTIFLDEIDSMPSGLQGKLLRVLSEKRLRRVGDTKERVVNVRVIAAMTRPPEHAVAAGLLREDLYYRLNVICLRIPPLRERREDIPLLIDHFISKFNRQLMMNVKGVSDEVRKLFLSYDWPGNVRELEHAIEGAMHMLDGDMILLEHLPEHIRKPRLQEKDSHLPFDDIIQDEELGSDFRETVRDLENTLIRRAYAKAGGNVSKTARILGIPRQTLQYRLRRLGIQEENPR